MTPATATGARRATAGRASAPASPARRAADRTVTRPGVSPRTPRRVSGPASGRGRSQTTPWQSTTVGARALAVVRSLPDHSLLDRLVRGRAWIPVLGVLLAGLVTMQVEILKLGTSMGRSIQRSTSLQSKNDSLQASIGTLANDQRIERLATGMGMVTPSPGILTFARANSPGQLGRALGNIHAPDPTGFAAQLASQLAAATLLAPPAPSTTGTSQTGSVGSTSTSPGSGTTGATVPQTGSGTTGAAGSGTGALGNTGSTTAAGQSTSGAGGTSTGAAAGGGTGSAGGTGASAGAPATGTAGSGASGAAGLTSGATSQSGSSTGP